MSDWNQLPSDEELNLTVQNIEKRGIKVILVNTKNEALKEVKKLIHEGAKVSAGSSTTLDEIGFSEYFGSEDFKGENLNIKIWSENDQKKRSSLRRLATTAEVFLGSINAISQNGELVAVDNTGSRVSAYPFAAQKLILVSGSNKITKDLESAMKRVREYVYPLEDERARKAYGMPSGFGKWVIIENEIKEDRIVLVLVKESLGF